MGVTPYSQADLFTGRVSTGLPVVGWGGRGPGISLSLYHHMTRPWGKPEAVVLKGDANLDGELDLADIDPFVDILLEGAPTQTEIAIADFNNSATIDTGDLP